MFGSEPGALLLQPRSPGRAKATGSALTLLPSDRGSGAPLSLGS